MKKVVQLARHKKLDIKTMLQEVYDQADEYEDMVIVARLKEPMQELFKARNDVWTSSNDKTMLWEASQTIADLCFNTIESEQ